MVKKSFKYYFGYKCNEKVKPLCIMLPKISGYRKSFNETRYISFLIKDDESLGKYNKTLNKVAIVLKKDLIVKDCTMKNI